MPPDNDGYLDVDLDDEPESPSSDVLDVNLDDLDDVPPLEGASSPSLKEPVTQSEPELPMTSAGICERCGYALRPLEEHCPRCGQLGAGTAAPSAEALAPTSEPAALPEVSPGAGRAGCSGWSVVAVVVVLLAIGWFLAWLWGQPNLRAQRAYRAGLQAQLANSFEQARQHYEKALELQPDMGLAALMMGTTYLRIGDPALMESINELVDRAKWGETGEVDRADEWFRRAIEIGSRLPASTKLIDPKINTPPRLRAFAHTFMALTALVRASAALQAEQLDDGMLWLGVVHREAQAALANDPGNEQAEKILREAPPQNLQPRSM